MEPEAIEPVAVRRETAAAMLDCSPTTIWRLCKEGKLDVVKVGSDSRVTVESIRRLAKCSA
jgi:hypothetical protein